jgi:uncharacterized protein YuzE
MSFMSNYDPDVDAAYFRIKDTRVLESEEIADGIIVDYDGDDNIVGIELLGIETINPKNFALLKSILSESLSRLPEDPLGSSTLYVHGLKLFYKSFLNSSIVSPEPLIIVPIV